MSVVLPYYGGSRPAMEVGPGWDGILSRLADRLMVTDPDYKVSQVKEKFGGLRFYTDGLSEDGYRAVSEAEAESYKVCENCGEPGDLDTSTYWVKTLCEKHKKIRRRR